MKHLVLKVIVRIFRKINSLNQNLIYSGYRKKYQIDPLFRFNGNNILFYLDGEIICGKHSYIGEYSTLQACPGKKVVIGQKCMISHNVRMYTQTLDPDHDFSDVPPPLKRR